MSKVHFIRFETRGGFKGVIDVPVDKVWQFYEDVQCTRQERPDCQPVWEMTKAIYDEFPQTGHREPDSWTWCKSWSVWDFKLKAWRLHRIGLGAYGDSSPIYNPDPEVKQKQQCHYSTKYAHHQWGINLAEKSYED